MKKLTLDQTWKLCLSMWRWIAKIWLQGTKLTVEELKEQWLDAHEYERKEIVEDCFFCEYASRYDSCSTSCPGVLIDTYFDCNHVEYDYETNPIAFYNKLVSLNRKRLKRRNP